MRGCLAALAGQANFNQVIRVIASFGNFFVIKAMAIPELKHFGSAGNASWIVSS